MDEAARDVERTNERESSAKRTEKKMGSEGLSKGNGSGPCPVLPAFLSCRLSSGLIVKRAGTQHKSDCEGLLGDRHGWLALTVGHDRDTID